MLECERLLEYERLQAKDKIKNKIIDLLCDMCYDNVRNDTNPGWYFDDLKELFKVYLECEVRKTK